MFAVSDASDVCHPAADAAAAAAAAHPHDKADTVGMAWHPTTLRRVPKTSTFYFLNNSVKN